LLIAYGAIYSIDFRVECKVLGGVGAWSASAGFRQGARTYVGGIGGPNCGPTAWGVIDEGRSLVAGDFHLIDGPVCGAAEFCPDFSAAGGPITFGIITIDYSVASGSSPLGVDNWQVSVWRH
jgi:hypothetical protein